MNKKNILSASLLALIALALTFSFAFAHGHIPVGNYVLVVGWAVEPPVVGQANAITIHVEDTTAPDKEVDASKLTAVLNYGGQSKTLTLKKSAGTKNQYEGYVLPSVAGQYTLQLGGKIDSTDVNVDAEPEEVDAVEKVAFPSVAAQTAPAAAMHLGDWLGGVALIVALAALVLALRKPRV